MIKFLRYGKDDVHESLQVLPHGIDSNPVKDMVAVYSPTDDKGDSVILGYILKKALVDKGEIKIFSTDDQGTEKFFLHCKKDGTAIFGGQNDNLVRYNPLASAHASLDAAINAELTKIAAGLAGVGGAYVPSPINTNILGAKITQIKTL